MKKMFLMLLLVSLVSSIGAIGLYKITEKPQYSIAKEYYPTSIPTKYNSYNTKAINNNFIEASNKTINAVVHVKNVEVNRNQNLSFFDLLYGYNNNYDRIQIGMGSGVIISADGLIITNNHVIENATEIEITTNDNKIYKAKLIGTDPSTDIALLKIDTEKDLEHLVFGDSNQTQVGEWVLAVGNPFNLTSTVTAGIVSAKSRDLNPYDGKNQSFIQTDAAVNPGNSGGALVNTNGQLIGINTAITSQTGNYVGYSFAVPSNIAKKIVDDIIEFGSVHRSILGVRGSSLNYNIAQEIGIEETEGFYISEVESFARANKLKKGDIIREINGIKIRNFADLSGFLSSKRPGDIVSAKILRNHSLLNLNIKLMESKSVQIPQLGISVQNLNETDKTVFSLNRGVKVVSSNNKMEHYGLQGNVILEINRIKINNIEDVKKALNKSTYKGRISLMIVDKNGNVERFIIQ